MLKCILERTNSPETFIEKVLSYGQIKFQNFASILYPNVCQSYNDLNKKTCLTIRTYLTKLKSRVKVFYTFYSYMTGTDVIPTTLSSMKQNTVIRMLQIMRIV